MNPNPQEQKHSTLNFFNKYAKKYQNTQQTSPPLPSFSHNPFQNQPILTQSSQNKKDAPQTYPTVTPQSNTYNFSPYSSSPIKQAPLILSFKQRSPIIKKKRSTITNTDDLIWQNTNYVQQPKESTEIFNKQIEGLNERVTAATPIKFQQRTQFQNIHSISSNKGMKRTGSINQNQHQSQLNHKKFRKQDFAIGKKLGKGQYGQVNLVQHKETGFLCGLKVMSKKQIKTQKYQNQIARQLSINFYLNHPNIAPLYGYFQDQQNVYLLMQYCTGGQLLSLLRKHNRLQNQQTSPIIRQICEGLTYVHNQQIIHRDIKPENILFNFDTVKICDFGWAVFNANGMRTTVSGSPLYYSPEIVMETAYDEKIDIWSIGMMTYECLLGKTPFRVYSELDLKRIVSDQIKFPEYVDVSDDAKDFILKIMKKNPQERMEMRDILKHPFITKYNRVALGENVRQQFTRVIG